MAQKAKSKTKSKAKAKKGVVVLVGTKKGAYILASGEGRARWTREGPFFNGEPVYTMAFDPRDQRSIYASVNATWGGPKVQVSRDLGKTWTLAQNPSFPAGDSKAFLGAWHIEAGHASRPNEVWLGSAPAALFKSTDRGMTWELVRGLTDHPTTPRWMPGGMGVTALHSIAIDPDDPDRLVIGISSAGAFRSDDGGLTWRPWNEGSRTPLIPDQPYAEFGQCVHHLVAHPKKSGAYFQQNHFGVYFRDAGDPQWTERSKGLPSDFGFASAIHPRDPETAYVIPLRFPERMTPDKTAAVYRTVDKGRTWKRLARGITADRLEILREGMAVDRLDPAGVYFGATNGEVWASANEGASWSRIAAYLPPIESISTGTIG